MLVKGKCCDVMAYCSIVGEISSEVIACLEPLLTSSDVWVIVLLCEAFAPQVLLHYERSVSVSSLVDVAGEIHAVHNRHS